MSGHSTPAGGARPAYVAAALAFASAAVSLFWALGGTLLLDTVGGALEDLARERSAAAVAGLAVVVFLKVAAGLLALALARPTVRRAVVVLDAVVAATLVLYGGVLVLVGALALAGAIGSSEPADEHALRWHVFVWDLWFLVWGAALGLAVLRRRRGAAR